MIGWSGHQPKTSWRRLSVGIDDETDKAEIEVHEIGENTYIVRGTMTLQ